MLGCLNFLFGGLLFAVQLSVLLADTLLDAPVVWFLLDLPEHLIHQIQHNRTTVQQIRKYYDEFLGWANEFDLASIPRKRTILAQLLERVELGRGYRGRIVVRGSYQQFLAGENGDKLEMLEGA